MSFKNFGAFLEGKKTAHKWSLPEKTEPIMPKKGKMIKPEDYYAPSAKQDVGLVTADDNRGTPLGHEASPSMTDPKKVQPHGKKPAPCPKKMKKPKKKMTESFLDKTANMSDAQFTSYMMDRSKKLSEQKIIDMSGKEFVPEPAETLNYVVNLAINENMMGRVVREIKRQGGLKALVTEALLQSEATEILTEASKDTRIMRKLEAVAGPRGMNGMGGMGGGGSSIGPSGATAGGPLTNPKVKSSAMPGMAGMTEEDDELEDKDKLDDIGGDVGDESEGDEDMDHDDDGEEGEGEEDMGGDEDGENHDLDSDMSDDEHKDDEVPEMGMKKKSPLSKIRFGQ